MRKIATILVAGIFVFGFNSQDALSDSVYGTYSNTLARLDIDTGIYNDVEALPADAGIGHVAYDFSNERVFYKDASLLLRQLDLTTGGVTTFNLNQSWSNLGYVPEPATLLMFLSALPFLRKRTS